MPLRCPVAEAGNIAEFKKLLTVGGLADLGPGSRPGVLPPAKLNEALDNLLNRPVASAGSRELLRALVLLWHDALEPAHVIAQNLENADGSFVHGIVHRREPDFMNAAYWFRRAGRHGSFPGIARRVGGLLETRNAGSLAGKLIPEGSWNPFVFINLCEEAPRRAPEDSQTQLLREIQAIEFEVLLEHFLNS